jgi:hypothetical protein
VQIKDEMQGQEQRSENFKVMISITTFSLRKFVHWRHAILKDLSFCDV